MLDVRDANRRRRILRFLVHVDLLKKKSVNKSCISFYYLRVENVVYVFVRMG